MRWIVTPSDPECADESVAGGKGASLARLRAMGARVPSLIVVRAQAHEAMARGGPDTEFLAELRVALEALDDRDGLAVRSSAIGEDAADASFAGLYHTSLDVRGFEAVVAAIERCWASYNEAAAADYRRTRGGARDGAMAVVIQELVRGEWSGVCFTANPVNLALSESLINAAPGLGEALVSGEVNTEEITVSASDGRVLRRQEGDEAAPFPDAALGAVWAASKTIADRLAFPQDVEWAWRGGELFILQSRPITTLADVFYSRALEPWKDDPAADPDHPDRLWSRMLADETWVSPISPLFYNIHNSTPGRVAFIRSHGDTSPLPPDLFKYHRATAYADVRLIQRMYEFQPPIARIRGVLSFLPAEMRDDLRRRRFRWLGRLRRMLSYEFHNRSMRSLFSNYNYVQAQWPAYVELSDRWFDTDLDSLSLDELRDHQAEVHRAMASVGPPCGIAVLSHATDLHLLLTGLLDRWARHAGSDGETLYGRISSGLDNSETVKEGEALWDLARALRDLGPPALELALTDRWREFKAEITNLAGGREFTTRFEAFWRDHRHVGSTYTDLIWPRWGDDIDQCFAVLKAAVASAAPRPSVVNAQSARQRRAAQAEILGGLSGPLAPLRRRLLRWLFRFNEIYMSVRDNHRFYVDRNWYELRRIYRSYGARLAAAGLLESADDVFFLGTAEVAAGLEDSLRRADAVRRIEVRRRVWEHTLRLQGPKFLKNWAPYCDRVERWGGDASNELRGIPASPGTTTGIARVVYDVRELSSVQDGEILVTRQTDPSWTTVFGRISGLVLETGGVLSHGTSLCREYGLPCVTAVERATARIADGARVELIGDEGVIRLLEAGPNPLATTGDLSAPQGKTAQCSAVLAEHDDTPRNDG
jgi:phosphohistidine swiveling domain-containing protein